MNPKFNQMEQTTNNLKVYILPMSVQEEAEENNRGLETENRRTSKQPAHIIGSHGRPV